MNRYLQHSINVSLCLALLGSEVMGGVAAFVLDRNKENCASVCDESQTEELKVETAPCCQTKNKEAISAEIVKLMETVEFAEGETCQNCPCCVPTLPSQNDLPKPLPENNDSVVQILQKAETTSPAVSLTERFSKFASREISTSPVIPLTDSRLLCVWLT